MKTLLNVVLVIHLLSWAVALGGVVVSMRSRRVPPGALHAVSGAVLTGVLLVLIATLGLDWEMDNLKIGLKLVVALAALFLLMLGSRRPERVTTGLLGAVAGLISLNVALAVLL
jgi:hypothetical protein